MLRSIATRGTTSASQGYFPPWPYHGYSAVLIRLEKIDDAELAERIEDAWLTRVPKRLAAEYHAEP